MILRIAGEHDDKTIEQLKDVDSRAEYTALMADGHFGYVMPIGGVAAYRKQVSIVGVGFDIACGNCAVRTNLTVDDLGDKRQRGEFADELVRYFAFGIGRNNDAERAPVNHSLLDDPSWEIIPRDAGLRAKLHDKARNQLGTLGSGNHYLDIFSDEDGYVWVGVHFGSRGFGHTIASSFLALSQGGQWGDRGKEVEILLDVGHTQIGSDYWDLMSLAGEYAYAGRNWVVDETLRLLGATETDRVHNNHNFAWIEEHFGEEYVVIRKGATPAFPGQRGFVGGSMGDDSVILHGIESDDGANLLHSTVHGAGRVMGRMEAKGKRAKDGTWKRKPRVDKDEMEKWLSGMGVIRRGGDLDEAPQAYRRLPDVLEAQGDTIEIEHTLTPLIVCMAGRDR